MALPYHLAHEANISYPPSRSKLRGIGPGEKIKNNELILKTQSANKHSAKELKP